MPTGNCKKRGWIFENDFLFSSFILVHVSEITNGGHYIAYIRPGLDQANNNKWFKFNDSTVTECSSTKNAIEDNYKDAYVLIYVKESSIKDVFCNVDVSNEISSRHQNKFIPEEPEEEARRKFNRLVLQIKETKEAEAKAKAEAEAVAKKLKSTEDKSSITEAASSQAPTTSATSSTRTTQKGKK